MANNVDFLAARFHARRSRLAEAERLDQLCRIRTVPEIGRTVFPGADCATLAAFQRRVVEEVARELASASQYVRGPDRELLHWMLLRFQLENLKVLLRVFLNHIPRESVERNLLPLPASLSLDCEALLAADNLGAFGQLLPRGVLRDLFRLSICRVQDPPPLFLLEAALDQAYFAELLERAKSLSVEDRELSLPVIEQEVNAFLLMLVVRGRFTYGLNPESLLPFHVSGCGFNRTRLRMMLAAPEPPAVVSLALRHAIDDRPAVRKPGETETEVDWAALEALAMRRLLRLANRAFRRSHMGFGAIVGYVVIRRVEAANLITVSEAIRGGITPEATRARMLPRYCPEVARA